MPDGRHPILDGPPPTQSRRPLLASAATPYHPQPTLFSPLPTRSHSHSTPPSRRSSYEQTDLWPLLAGPAQGITLSFVKAERSTFRWGGGDEARIRGLGHAVHELKGSGHWVHTDNPGGLFDILAPSFGGTPDLHTQRSPPGSPRGSSGGGSGGMANNIAPSPAAAASRRQLDALLM